MSEAKKSCVLFVFPVGLHTSKVVVLKQTIEGANMYRNAIRDTIEIFLDTFAKS